MTEPEINLLLANKKLLRCLRFCVLCQNMADYLPRPEMTHAYIITC